MSQEITLTGNSEWNWRYERRFYDLLDSAFAAAAGNKGFIVKIVGYRSKTRRGLVWCWCETMKGVTGVSRVAKKVNPDAIVAHQSVAEIIVAGGWDEGGRS